MDALIAHYHEIGLKGRNRDFFEQALENNLRRALRGTGYERIRRMFGRVVVDFGNNALLEEALDRAARVFGVAYVGLGRRVSPDLDEIGRTALDLMLSQPFESFSVRARRSQSVIPLSSTEINVVVGQKIKDETGGRVDLKHADATAWIELFGKSGVIYRKRREGPGGLPSGVSGRMLALLSGGIDSPVGAWRLARRGAEVEMVHFHGQPYTDPSSVRQAVELTEVHSLYQLKTLLHLIPLSDVQREIVTHSPAPLRVVLYRRTMMRIAAELARQRDASALVTGDSLGQVASQTIENIHTVDSAIPGVQVLRPLIGEDKQGIITEAKTIGTYEISARRYQDCCVLFEPRSPETRDTPEQADEAEAELDMDAMVGKALAGMETREVELAPPNRP